MTSIKDVADAAGVSTATVSRVLADKPVQLHRAPAIPYLTGFDAGLSPPPEGVDAGPIGTENSSIRILILYSKCM